MLLLPISEENFLFLYLGLHCALDLGKTKHLNRLDFLHTSAQQTGKGLEA